MASRRWVHGQGTPRKKGDAGKAEGFGRNPTDRGKLGTKRHLRVSGEGLPLSILITAANVNDSLKLAELLDGHVLEVPPEAEAQGLHLCLDLAYESKGCRAAAQERGFTVHIQPKPGKEQPQRFDESPAPTQQESSTEASEGSPSEGEPRKKARRWVVEVCHSWLNRWRRVLVRWEKRSRNYLGFVQLAICLLIERKIRKRLKADARSLSG